MICLEPTAHGHPCNRCRSCIRRSIAVLLQSLRAESRLAEAVYFGTLTWPDETRPADDNSAYPHIQAWSQRVRFHSRKTGLKFRYVTVPELGSKNGNLHYHVMVFVTSWGTQTRQEGASTFLALMRDQWPHRDKFDRVWKKEWAKTFRYLAKYLGKDFGKTASDEARLDKRIHKPWRASIGFGSRPSRQYIEPKFAGLTGWVTKTFDGPKDRFGSWLAKELQPHLRPPPVDRTPYPPGTRWVKTDNPFQPEFIPMPGTDVTFQGFHLPDEAHRQADIAWAKANPEAPPLSAPKPMVATPAMVLAALDVEADYRLSIKALDVKTVGPTGRRTVKRFQTGFRTVVNPVDLDLAYRKARVGPYRPRKKTIVEPPAFDGLDKHGYTVDDKLNRPGESHD